MISSTSESKPFQSRSKGEIPGQARRKERLSRSRLKQAFLIDSDAELFMYLRWLDTVFQGQYLPSLSINYVAKNKVLEKLPPNDAIAYFTCSSISRHWELFFEKHSRELFPLITASMFVKFKRNL